MGATSAVWLAAAAGAAVITACGQTIDTSAPYFPSSSPAPTVALPLQAFGAPPDGPRANATGAVSRPNPKYTPGAVALTNVAAVCALPAKGNSSVGSSMGNVVAAEYGITFDPARYGMDYLVPIELGGSYAEANVWPVAQRGVGFHQKEQLNARLRELVCNGSLPLDQVQAALESDWYVLYLRYG